MQLKYLFYPHMKKFLLLFSVILLFGFASWVSAQITRSEACSYQNGIFEADWPVNYPGYNTKIKNFYKKWDILYYAVNAYKNTASTPIGEAYLWSFNCKTKKATRLSTTPLLQIENSDYSSDKSWPYAEIDYADDTTSICY
jgi:hypothetical protein